MIMLPLFMGVSGFILLNLNTAVVVDFTFNAMRSDEEMQAKHKKHREQQQIQKLVLMSPRAHAPERRFDRAHRGSLQWR